MKTTSKRTFTFLELIIAVSITAMIAVGLYSYSHGVTDSWGQVLNKRNAFNELLNVDRAVDNALTNAIPFIWRDRDNDNEEYPFIVASSNFLRIAYLHRVKDEIEGAIRFAQFEVNENSELIMRYTTRPFREWEQIPSDMQTVVRLAENIDSIRFVYADWNDQEDDDWETRLLWLDDWETEESERQDIPLAIGMYVTWKDGHSYCWFRRTMGNSYRERFGKWTPLSEDKR